QNQKPLAFDLPPHFDCQHNFGCTDHQCPRGDVDDQSQGGYCRCVKGKQANHDSENSNDELPTPIWVGRTMPDRAHDAKNTVNQDPGPKEQHKCRSSHNWMSERDYSEDNCSDTP